MTVHSFRSISYRRIPPLQTGCEFSDDELLALWKSGLDTYDIAACLQAPEHQVERRLHTARDAECAEAEWSRA